MEFPTPAGIEKRRAENLQRRRKKQQTVGAANWKTATARAKVEKRQIIADLKKLPLRKLKAIHKAAQQAFNAMPTPDPETAASPSCPSERDAA